MRILKIEAGAWNREFSPNRLTRTSSSTSTRWLCQFRAPDHYSRSGCTQFRHIKFCCCIHFKSWRFSLIFMFWPFSGILLPTMTSASKNQYRQPRCRVPLSKIDAVYIWSTVFLLHKPVFACTGTWPLSAVLTPPPLPPLLFSGSVKLNKQIFPAKTTNR
jgi:hypothetical protein